jgi:3-hydroxybutyryl-CoA dehydrogenase
MLDASRADLVAGVAGSGTMGRGIVQVLAQSGVRTLVFDAQAGAAGKARDSIAQTLGKLAERGKLERGAVEATLERIEVVEHLEALAPCQLVVEAIVEDLGAKRELLSKLEGVVGPDAVLASNTSSLSVTAMAAACKRPQRVAGYHFFNPVPVMKVVEVVAGELTEPAVTGALSALARRFGHTPIAC